MADDNFIREVNEEYRQDQAKALFDKYGFWAIGVAIIIILAAAGWRGYDYWQSKQAAASGGLAPERWASSHEGSEKHRGLGADGRRAVSCCARQRPERPGL